MTNETSVHFDVIEKSRVLGRSASRQFAEEFLYIRDNEKRIIPLRMNNIQKRVYATIKSLRARKKPIRIIILKARREGLTTGIASELFVNSFCIPNTTTVVTAHDQDTSNKIFEIYKLFYQKLPDLIRHPTSHSSKRELAFADAWELDDGVTIEPLRSSMIVRTANAKRSGRAMEINNWHWSEVAFTEEGEELMLSMMQAISDKADTMIVLESTANGQGNFFHEQWLRAKSGEIDFIPLFFGWNEFPAYQRDFESEAHRNVFKKAMSPEEHVLRKQYKLSYKQLHWRRWKIKNYCGGNLNKFRQEYPINDEEAFIGSGVSFFDKEIMRENTSRMCTKGERGRLEETKQGLVFFKESAA